MKFRSDYSGISSSHDSTYVQHKVVQGSAAELYIEVMHLTSRSHDCNFSWKYHTCNQHNTRLVLPDIIGYAPDIAVGYSRIFSISRVAKEW